MMSAPLYPAHLYQSAPHQHPVPLDFALPIFVVGLVVFLTIAYDFLRNYDPS